MRCTEVARMARRRGVRGQRRLERGLLRLLRLLHLGRRRGRRFGLGVLHRIYIRRRIDIRRRVNAACAGARHLEAVVVARDVRRFGVNVTCVRAVRRARDVRLVGGVYATRVVRTTDA